MRNIGNQTDQIAAHVLVASFKQSLAKQISVVLDDGNLSSKRAQDLTGINASEFSRLRNLRTERFTIDRLVVILVTLGFNVELKADTTQVRSLSRLPIHLEGHA